jgi:hypothetical protein
MIVAWFTLPMLPSLIGSELFLFKEPASLKGMASRKENVVGATELTNTFNIFSA